MGIESQPNNDDLESAPRGEVRSASRLTTTTPGTPTGGEPSGILSKTCQLAPRYIMKLVLYQSAANRPVRQARTADRTVAANR
jgi:hypothetical protein